MHENTRIYYLDAILRFYIPYWTVCIGNLDDKTSVMCAAGSYLNIGWAAWPDAVYFSKRRDSWIVLQFRCIEEPLFRRDSKALKHLTSFITDFRGSANAGY